MKTRRTSRSRSKGHQLFNDARGTPRVKGTGYGSRKKAQATLKKLCRRPRSLQRQIATTMFYRAKYHKYQTQGMRNAMAVYRPFLRTFKGGAADWVQRIRPAYIEDIESRSTPLPADQL